MGQLCARRQAEPAPRAPAKPTPGGVVERADAQRAEATVASAPLFSGGVQELRRRGVRPLPKGYNDTPLLTIGKQVRVLKESGFRDALIEYVNDDGTVDVAYEDGDKEDETVPGDAVRPLEAFESSGPQKRELTKEEKRQMGVRANAPDYAATPLLSIGKRVRVKNGTARVRRAEIEYVDAGAGTVDVRYLAPAEAWPGATVVKKGRKELTEEAVPVAAVLPLQEFETRKETSWKKLFQENFYGAIEALKEGADELFMEVRDNDAALEFYSMAVDRLAALPLKDKPLVLVRQGVGMELVCVGRVNAADATTRQAFVELMEAQINEAGEETKTVRVALEALTPIHEKQVALQGSLYANRARIWAQLERFLECERDLSMVIALQEVTESGEEWKECLSKARLLRAKINLAEERTVLAKEDVSAALALEAEETKDIVWKFYKEMEQQVREKKIDKDVGKFARTLPTD